MATEALEPRIALSAQGSVAPLSVDTIPASKYSQETIQIGKSRSNVINHLGDHDWYRVSLVAGIQYRFLLVAKANGPVPALGNPFLRLRYDSEYIVKSDDDSGGNLNSLLWFTPNVPGTYFLDVGGWADRSTGRYKLSVQQITPTPADDFAANDQTWGTIQVNKTATGKLKATGNLEKTGDRDWFRVTLVGGRTYRITVDQGAGWPRLTDSNVHLRNRFGISLAYNDNSTFRHQHATLVYKVAKKATFYIDVGGTLRTKSHDGISGPPGQGSYSVRVQQL